MKLCFIFTLICMGIVSSKDVARINDKELMVVNDLIRRIRDDNWYKEEAPCLESILALLNDVKNQTLWATWVWESNQSPIGNLYGSTYQMGNYDQCMNPPWLTTHPLLKTQYCTAEVKMIGDEPQKGRNVWDPYDSTVEYINTATKQGLYLNTLHWGVCVPASCSARSVGKLLKHMYRGSQYAPVAPEPNITVEYCQVAGEDYQYPLGFYLFIATIVLLLAVAVASTIYQNNADINDQHLDALDTILSKAFCMKRNYSKLTKPNPEEIPVINGMRFITTCMLVLGHQVAYFSRAPMINPLNMERDFESRSGILFLHLEITVDTFFAISGILYMRGLMRNSERQINLFLALWKRYFRLIGPLAVTIFYQIYVAKYAGSGPFWPKAHSDEHDVCANTWRLSLMMLNTNIEKTCHIVTWYIACDYQLAILGTVLFYFYQRDKKLGYTAFVAAAALSVIIPGVFVYWHRLPAMPFPDLRAMMYTRHQITLNYNYTKSYVRANAYLVGIAMGYFMSVFKPADNRRAISTKWSLIGTIGCVVTMLTVMSLGKFFLHREYSVLESIITTSLNRAVWAFAVCCIIAFCEYGNVPIIRDFLSLPAFIPLSRLAYGIYVIHPIVIQRNYYSARTPLKYEMFPLITESLGTVCISACISFAMWLLIEAPCINLSNTLFINKSRNQTTTTLTQESKEEFVSKEVKKNSVPTQCDDVYAASNKTKIS